MSAERALAVEVALAKLHRAGGYRRGLAARLARIHGGGASTWERAVSTARTAYGAQDQHRAQRPAPE
ncbi:hypothetical protein ABT185_34215 [Streptomyces clavifer]|uniref:hypothetical protein n=1 Tax=Streptomyces clavifer TaxID=68188 RepID=UPI003328702E